MDRVRLFGEISKVEDLPDGTRKVSGIASTEHPDSQGEVITADAMRGALPDYMKFPAVREKHRTDGSAGTGLAAMVDEEGRTHFEALVVDPVAIKKVDTKC